MEINPERINRIWHVVRPFWTVVSGIVFVIIVCTLNWAKVSQYDTRLVALELWRIQSTENANQESKDLAVVKTQVEDIHDYLIPEKSRKTP